MVNNMDWVKVVKHTRDSIQYTHFLPIIGDSIQGNFEKNEFYDRQTQFHEFYDFNKLYGDIIEEFSFIELKNKFLNDIQSPIPFQLGIRKVVIVVHSLAGAVVVDGPHGPFVVENIVGELETNLARIDNYLLEKIFEGK